MDGSINTIKEKVMNYGICNITDLELVKFVTDNEFTKAKGYLGGINFLDNLQKKNSKEIIYSYGLTKYQAQKLEAVLELVKRLMTPKLESRYKISDPETAAAYIMPRLFDSEVEQFAVVSVNCKNHVIGFEVISKGSLNSSIVHPREVFNMAIVNHAAGIIVAHNHPSGVPEPSREDKDLTKTLSEAGKMLGIPILDHLIIGERIYYSFKEHGDI